MIHLHTHTDYSLLDGFSTFDEYLEKAQEYGMNALALTEHNTMTSAYHFIKKCKKMNIKPIIGVELNIAPKDSDGTIKQEPVQFSSEFPYVQKGAYTHLTVIAKNRTGFFNLTKLLKYYFKEENVFRGPRIPLDLLIENKEGLIVLSGCENSELFVRSKLKQTKEVLEYLKTMKVTFGENFYIELSMPSFIEKNNPKVLKPSLFIRMAEKLSIPYVITNDVHYAKQDQSRYQEFFLAIGSNSRLTETPTTIGGTRRVMKNEEYYFKSEEEMIKTCQSLGMTDEEIKLGIENTHRIADSVEDYNLKYNSHLRPKIEVPAQFKNSLAYLDYLIVQGFKKKRAKDSDEVKQRSKERIKMEREVILANDFVDYFLVVHDYCKWSEDNGYPIGAGRGSAAGSEIMYLLNVTKVDPLRFNLIFERFISPGRGADYELTFDDGSVEKFKVSDKVRLVDGTTKYVHQIVEGDEIVERV